MVNCMVFRLFKSRSGRAWLEFHHFLKGAQAGGQTWDLLVFVYLLSLKQRLRPLGYWAPLSFYQALITKITDISL